MKKIFIIICLILVIISGFLICCTNKQKEKISALESSISELKKEILISTFVITQKTDSEISMKIRLFDYGGKERIDDLRHHHAYGVAFPGFEGYCNRVGFVSPFLCQFLHLLAGLLADFRVVFQSPGYGRD